MSIRSSGEYRSSSAVRPCSGQSATETIGGSRASDASSRGALDVHATPATIPAASASIRAGTRRCLLPGMRGGHGEVRSCTHATPPLARATLRRDRVADARLVESGDDVLFVGQVVAADTDVPRTVRARIRERCAEQPVSLLKQQRRIRCVVVDIVLPRIARVPRKLAIVAQVLCIVRRQRKCSPACY